MHSDIAEHVIVYIVMTCSACLPRSH